MAFSPADLTPRQLLAAQLAAQGLRIADIADAMDVAPNTVKTHLRLAYQQLGVANRIGLRVTLERAGLVGDFRNGREETGGSGPEAESEVGAEPAAG
jgi:DNA-binding NarL/FixJ family response regulator